MQRRLIVVGGPTASGKSALALAIAEAVGGTIVNADSMQVYRELPILSAAPSAEERARVPHRLYGVLPAAEVCSAARWRDMALAEIAVAWDAGRVPVLVGGTGLYINALLRGLSPIPEIPEAVRAAARALFADLGNAAFHARLAERDPLMATRLDPGNSQRLVRAWEVIEATGQSLAAWQSAAPIGVLAEPALPIVLEPPREALYASIDRRFLEMMERGALNEVAAIGAAGLDPALPAMKALGIPELRRHLQGQIGREQAVALAQQASRHYAKRQITWFRHQMGGEALRLGAQLSESLTHKILPIIRRFLLTP